MSKDGNPEQAATTEELKAQLEEAKKQAEIAEKRRKDTVSAYTKGQQEIKALKAQNESLLTKVGSTIEESEEMQELKLTNPDEWYKRRQALETEKKNELHQELAGLSTKASQEVIQEQRANILDDFNKSHPDLQLSDEILDFDVPLRFKTQLEKGEVDYETYLQNAYDFLKKPKKIGDGNKIINQPDLGELGGGDIPSKTATAVDIVQSYKTENF